MTERRMQETCDMLLDCFDANPGMSEDEQAILYEAWEQQDLYPCASGEQIRIDINAEAIEAATARYEQRQRVAAAIRVVAAAKPQKTIYVVTQTPVNHARAN